MRRFAIESLKLVCLLVMLDAAAEAQTTCNSPCTMTKTPYEQYLVSVDFSQVMGTDSMTLDSVTAVVGTKVGGTDATSTLIGSSPVPAIAPSTYRVVFLVQAGSDNTVYRIGVRAIDSTTGAKWEGVILMQVKF